MMEYNVENLFDFYPDSVKSDEEFQPKSVRKWTKSRFWTKLNHISKVIAAATENQIPDIVVLCEVENDSTMHYLTRRSPLRNLGYSYVMTDSPDERGIDIAFLYQNSTFKLLNKKEFVVDYKKLGRRPTRNILYVSGLTQTNDTLDIFCCHMPSRSKGKKESEPYRIHTASILRHLADSIMHVRETPRIIITGDFNDHPQDIALSKVLGARTEQESTKQAGALYNLIYNKTPGTYKFQGVWETIDQFIVSGNLLIEDPGHLSITTDLVHILSPEFVLIDDEKYGGKKPFRTYDGMRYLGGYSDHLPIVADFIW